MQVNSAIFAEIYRYAMMFREMEVEMRLKDYLRIYNIKVKDFAEKLGYTRPHLYDVMRGRYQAGRLLIEAVEKETNGIVKKEDWVNGKPFDPNQLLFKFMEDNHD